MYSETQRPRLLSWRLALFVVPLWAIGLAGVGNIDLRLLLFSVALAVIPATAILKVRVDAQRLRIRVYGVPIRTIPLDRIEGVVVRDLDGAQRHGWSTFSASTYNWAGLKHAVEFREVGKGRVRIGSRRPEQLASALGGSA
jgi:hypothetical protein